MWNDGGQEDQGMLKRLWIALSLVLVIAQGAMAEPYTLDAEGVVQEIDLVAGSVIITGFSYQVPNNAKIKVGGNLSSAAALVAGMKVFFTYLVYEGIDAEVAGMVDKHVITELQQLPDSYVIEEF
jgi:uncharacterized protein YjeT (DUF2065 family)